MNQKEVKEEYWRINKKAGILIIILILASCVILGVQALLFFEKDETKNEIKTYTDKEIKDATVIEFSDYHKTTNNNYDRNSGYDSTGLYNLEVYVTSDITTTACLEIGQYNDSVLVRNEKITFGLLKDATVVKSSIRINPKSLLYNNEHYEEANLSWGVVKITSGECK